MKYGYIGADNSELIQKFQKSDNKIIVTFLDGSTRTLPLTEEYEKNLLEIMLKQAIERSQSDALLQMIRMEILFLFNFN